MTDWRRIVEQGVERCHGRERALEDFDLQVQSGIPEARAARLAIKYACCRGTGCEEKDK